MDKSRQFYWECQPRLRELLFNFASEASPIQALDSGDLEELELLLWTPEELVRALDAGEARSLGTVSFFLWGYDA